MFWGGAACILYGLFTAFMRITHPEGFGKIEPMKKLWGEKVGATMHFLAYTLLPITFGVFLILTGIFFPDI